MLKEIKLDMIDRDLLNWNWSTGSGYAMCNASGLVIGYGTTCMHRMVLQRKLGRYLRADEFTDHINGDKLDNRRSNLRAVTAAQNARNAPVRHGKNTRPDHKYKGVYKYPWGWKVRIFYDGKEFFVGTSKTQDEAAWMYDQWAMALHGAFARTNFEYYVSGLQ